MKEEAKERLAKNIESAYAREQFPRDALSNASLAKNATYACVLKQLVGILVLLVASIHKH